MNRGNLPSQHLPGLSSEECLEIFQSEHIRQEKILRLSIVVNWLLGGLLLIETAFLIWGALQAKL